jgi:hypothetical protein
MRFRRSGRCILGLSALVSLLLTEPGNCAAGKSPESCAPALDTAAELLSKLDFEAAARLFAEIARNEQNPAFVRGLASVGIAQTASAKGDDASALRAWGEIAGDSTP